MGSVKGKVNHKMRIGSKADQTRFDFTTAGPGLCQAYRISGKAEDLEREFLCLWGWLVHYTNEALQNAFQ